MALLLVVRWNDKLMEESELSSSDEDEESDGGPSSPALSLVLRLVGEDGSRFLRPEVVESVSFERDG